MDESAESRALREEAGATFGRVAEVYERSRPGYPERAIRFLGGDSSRRILDLGAGTGKLTVALQHAGHDLVAVDPAGPMLAELAANSDISCVRAGAEKLPFSSNAFDTVVVAQAFHWFDTAAALPEIARVLRDGGTLALVWNVRDESIPWARKLTEIVGSEQHDLDAYAAELVLSGLFTMPERATFGFWQQLDLPGLLGLVRSRSYVVALGQPARDEVLARVRRLYEEYASGHSGLRLRYSTRCYRAIVDKAALPGEPEPPGGGDLLFDFR